MDHIFEQLDKEKRDRIINSALEEFSKNSFEKASTNVIVKNAGISKGSLYHYFSNKKTLYEYLQAFVYRIIIKEINDKIDWSESDIIERIRKIVILKLKVVERYPYLFDFSLAMVADMSIDQIKEQAEEHAPGIYEKVYCENIDHTLFREGIDVTRAINVISWTMEKYSELNQKQFEIDVQHIDLNAVLQEFESYILLLKQAFYR